jgi:HlyD family secretion protein
MKRSRKFTMLAAAVIVMLGGVWGFTSLNGAAAGVDPSRLATVERGTMVRSVVATGKIEPVTKVELKSKANGIIEKLYVDVDQVVVPGQVLAELDKEQLRARVRELEANLMARRAALEAAQAQLTKNTIEAEAPDVAFARRSYERALSLFKQSLLAQSGLDDAKSAMQVAENKQRAAQGQLVVSRARVTEAEAAVAEARAAIERAQEDLANSTIRAPIRATVLTRDVELGSPVSSILNLGANATLVMTLGDIDSVFVRGKVDEADIGRVRLGQRAKITVETFKDHAFEGRVTQISPIGAEKDNVTTFEVKVSIENAEKELKANMTANAEIVLEEHPESLIIPEAAISYDAQRRPTVEVIDPGAKNGRRSVTITTGVGNGTRTQVIGGLKEGDKIVLPS